MSKALPDTEQANVVTLFGIVYSRLFVPDKAFATVATVDGCEFAAIVGVTSNPNTIAFGDCSGVVAPSLIASTTSLEVFVPSPSVAVLAKIIFGASTVPYNAGFSPSEVGQVANK